MVQSVKKAEIYWNEVTNASLKKRTNQIAMPTYLHSLKRVLNRAFREKLYFLCLDTNSVLLYDDHSKTSIAETRGIFIAPNNHLTKMTLLLYKERL